MKNQEAEMTALERLEAAAVAFGVAAVSLEESAMELQLTNLELDAVGRSAISIERIKRKQKPEQG